VGLPLVREIRELAALHCLSSLLHRYRHYSRSGALLQPSCDVDQWDCVGIVHRCLENLDSGIHTVHAWKHKGMCHGRGVAGISYSSFGIQHDESAATLDSLVKQADAGSSRRLC
jgi:hypothetical protein